MHRLKRILAYLDFRNWSYSAWSIPYFYRRINYALWYRANPDKPWIVQSAVAFLDNYLSTDDVVMEWGSGRSTLYFAKKCKFVTSCEHNQAWFHAMRTKVMRAANVQYLYYETQTWVASEMSPSFNIALVDGIERANCAFRAAQLLSPGGLLILDNAERYIPSDSKASSSSLASIEEDFEYIKWRIFINTTKDWEKYYFTNNLFDTTIFCKPL